MTNRDLRALAALRRLRRVETDAARRDLGDALAQEMALAARDAAMEQELDLARQAPGEFDREAFSAWLRRVRAEREQLAAALRDAETRTAAARATLAHRRVAQTAAEETLAQKMTMLEAAAAWRDQLVLEDVARTLTRTNTLGDGK